MTEIEKLEGFACQHGDGKKEAMAALRAEVCEALKVEPDQLVGAVVQSLNWDYSVSVTSIPTDMWSAIKSEYARFLTDEEIDALPEDSDADDWVIEATAYIQCDRIEDGFALTWKTWKEWSEAKKSE